MTEYEVVVDRAGDYWAVPTDRVDDFEREWVDAPRTDEVPPYAMMLDEGFQFWLPR